MNNLIPFEQKLKQIQNLLKSDQPPMFPHIVLIGPQGAGKTSLLENFIGFRIFPRAATCCPVIVHLKSNGQVMFQIGNLRFSDPADVQAAILREMESIKDMHSGAVFKPILIEVGGPRYVDLTLIDLPGIPQVSGDLPSAIQLKKLCHRFIKTPNAVILVVLPANTGDVFTNDCMKFVRAFDNIRTILVINKLDTLNSVDPMIKILNGEKLPGILKIVGVISKHAKEKRKLDDLFKRERKFLNSKFPKIAHLHGMKALETSIANLLREHLKFRLSDYWTALSHAVSQTQKELRELGTPCDDPNRVIIEEVTRYASVFCSFLSGRTWEIETVALVGGARISSVFREIFNPSMDAHDPLHGLSRGEMLTALRNANGTRPEILFIPEACFEGLARRQVNHLASTCHECVEMVLDQMLQLSRDAANPNVLQRFPLLYDKMFKVAADLIQRRYLSCCELVSELLKMELGYINTLDGEFQKAVDSAKIKWLSDRGYLERRDVTRQKDSVDNNLPSWFSGFLQRKDVGDPCPTAPAMPSNCGIFRISAHEDAHCEILEGLLVFYFNIVRKSLKDGIPKAIMMRLVNYVNDHLYGVLLEELQNEKFLERDLLTEPESIVQQRQQLTAHYKNLQNVEKDIADLQEMLRRPIS